MRGRPNLGELCDAPRQRRLDEEVLPE